MAEPITSLPIFKELILPFLLVFALIFAILEKTKLFGDDKKQVNAIIAFVVGLIFVSFSKAVGIATQIIGLMALIAIILLVFMLLYGFASGTDLKAEKWMKITFGVLVGIALIVALLIFSGYWSYVVNAFKGESGSSFAANVVFIAIIIAAIAIVMKSGKSS